MKTTIDLQNVTACGCNNSIHKGLAQLKGVFGVKVEPEKGRITVEHTDEVGRDRLVAKLHEMGYRLREEASCDEGDPGTDIVVGTEG